MDTALRRIRQQTGWTTFIRDSRSTTIVPSPSSPRQFRVSFTTAPAPASQSGHLGGQTVGQRATVFIDAAKTQADVENFALHEIGHLLDLRDGTSGVMTKPQKNGGESPLFFLDGEVRKMKETWGCLP